MTLALWLLIYLAIGFGIGRLFEVLLGWKTVRLIFYPGMLVAAAGRFVACLVSQQNPGDVDILRSSGPTTGGADKLPGGWWFRSMYAVGPFLLSVAAFVVCWNLLGEPLDPGRTLPRLAFESSALERSADAASRQLEGVLDSLGRQRLGDWRMWLFLYLGFSFIVAPAPSKDDLISVGVFSAAVGLIVFGLAQAGVDVVARGVYRGPFWEGFSFLVTMALLVVVLTFLVLLPLRLLQKRE